MTGSSKVVFSRLAGGHRDRMRAYILELDGAPCAKIKPGEEHVVDVPPGVHTARARIDWSGSPMIEFVVQPGESARIQVEPAGTAIEFWQAFSRTRYIRLTLYGVAQL
jgi:hypothetical protein